MDIEVRSDDSDSGQCVAGMSDKIAANPLDSSFITEQTRIFRGRQAPKHYEKYASVQ